MVIFQFAKCWFTRGPEGKSERLIFSGPGEGPRGHQGEEIGGRDCQRTTGRFGEAKLGGIQFVTSVLDEHYHVSGVKSQSLGSATK